MIEVRQLTVRAGGHGRLLASDVDFHLRRGDVMAVLGPNGRGKTTLLRTLLGLQSAAAGQVRLDGPAAYVPQRTGSVFSYPVLSMVTMGRARHLRWWQSPRPMDFTHARHCLQLVGLPDKAQSSFNALSGGEQQLVHIASALASESPILVLDEPMSALDLANQSRVLAILRRLAQQGLTIVFSTHNPQHALHVASHTLLMAPASCQAGCTSDMCSPERLRQVYQISVTLASAQSHDGRQVTGVVPIYE
ncbi:MAG: ABC transporter ATP-binding protein [Burkholderiaceae bacterium]|jgi:iron complex transport system ATP-binding protein|nr:ABC transporter ATP-binding protein [Burkholderiaceae bacterium]